MYSGFIAILSNGQTVAENEHLKIIFGERKPWVRFVAFLEKSNLFIEKLSFQIGDEYHEIPRADFYALEYRTEVEYSLSGSQESEKNLVDIISGFDGFEVHYLIDLDSGESNLEVTEGYKPMAPAPIKRAIT